jgi:hypothetical protein
MVDLEAPAEEIGDPQELLERIAYRNARLLDSTGSDADPVSFVYGMSGPNRTDIRRLAEILGYDISHLIP